MSLPKIQKTMKLHSVPLLWEAIKPPSLPPNWILPHLSFKWFGPQQCAACSAQCVNTGCISSHSKKYVHCLLFLLQPLTCSTLFTADHEHKDSEEFRRFWRSLFHGSLNQILQSLQPYMEKPEVVRYGDGHYRRTIYGLGPYIADYPEQVLLACIVQGWCPRYDWHLIIHM